MRNLLLLLFLSLILFSDEEYKLGEGIQVGSLPFYIGGYFSLDYIKKEGETKYSVDDIAILGYGNYNKFSYMVELEYKELYSYIDRASQTYTEKDSHLYTERLYVDYNHDENYMFRAGKYNSNIGFWNLLPINVLRETTSSPQSTYIIFPKFTTGLDSSYTSYEDGGLKINATLQHNDSIDNDDYNNYEVDKHYGAGLSYEMDELTLKVNAGYFHTDYDINKEDLYYVLVSAKYEADKYQILTEFGSQKTKEEYTTKYAGYIQGAYYFTQQHIGVLRAESYDNKRDNISEEIMVVGYTYRPLYPIALKSEYQFHSKEDDNKLLLSLSVLF